MFLSIELLLAGCGRPAPPATEKADVVAHPKVLNHVGLPANGPPGTAGLPFV
jgi:hypothetical protein